MLAGHRRDVRQRPVEQVQQRVVLPEANPEGDGQHDPADDQPRAELIEVLDDAQPIFVPDGPQGLRPCRALSGVRYDAAL